MCGGPGWAWWDGRALSDDKERLLRLLLLFLVLRFRVRGILGKVSAVPVPMLHFHKGQKEKRNGNLSFGDCPERRSVGQLSGPGRVEG